MRRLVALALLLVVCGLAQAEGLVVGARAPDLTLTDLAGNAVKLSDGHGGQVTVLAFGHFSRLAYRTATGELERLQQRYQGDRVGIYAVSLDGPSAWQIASAAVKRLGLTFPVLLQRDRRLAEAYRVAATPHLVVMDPEGVIRLSQVAHLPDLSAKLTALIEQYRPPPLPKLPRLLDIEGLGCAACRTMPSVLRELQRELVGKVVIEILDFSPDLVDQYQFEVTPTQLFHDANGQEVHRHGGPLSKAEILDQFRKMGVAVD
jgi:thioredoxin 1